MYVMYVLNRSYGPCPGDRIELNTLVVLKVVLQVQISPISCKLWSSSTKSCHAGAD